MQYLNLLPISLPAYIPHIDRSNFSKSVVEPSHVLLFAESDGHGGSKFIAKKPDGTFFEVTAGSSVNFYKCASVSSGAWTGYLATIDPVTGVWSFAETATSGLTYSWLTPVPGKVYAGETCICEIARYNSGTSGHSRFALTSVFEATEGDSIAYNASYSSYNFTSHANVNCLQTNGPAVTYTLPSSYTTDGATFAFWAYHGDGSAGGQRPFGISGPNFSPSGFHNVETRTGSDVWSLIGANPGDTKSKWVLIAIVFASGGNEYGYICYSNGDGTQVRKGNSPQAITAGAGKVLDSIRLGNAYLSAAENESYLSFNYQSYIADLQIWDRALTENEITAIFAAGPHGTVAS